MKLEKRLDGDYTLKTDSGGEIGDIYKEVDGYFVFYPLSSGCYYEHVLRYVSDKLNELNKEWDETVEKDFSKKCTRKPRSKRK